MRRVTTTLLALALGACVDSGTGTGPGGTDTGVSNSDPSGNWNATQYTYTSKTDATVKADLILLGQPVSLVIAAGGQVTGGGLSGTLSQVGDSLTIKGSDSTVVAAGHFSRSGNTMTLDLSGKNVVYDFDHDAVADPALLHAVLVSIAH